MSNSSSSSGSNFSAVAIPYSLALQWFIYAVLEYFIAGIGTALVFGKKK